MVASDRHRLQQIQWTAIHVHWNAEQSDTGLHLSHTSQDDSCGQSLFCNTLVKFSFLLFLSILIPVRSASNLCHLYTCLVFHRTLPWRIRCPNSRTRAQMRHPASRTYSCGWFDSSMLIPCLCWMWVSISVAKRFLHVFIFLTPVLPYGVFTCSSCSCIPICFVHMFF